MSTEPIFLAFRECASMASCWNEYLCFEEVAPNRYRLFSGGYGALAEREIYYNEERDQYDLPEHIDGRLVVGIEDDYIVGGDIVARADYPDITFTDPSDPRLPSWLKQTRWDTKIDPIRLATRLVALVSKKEHAATPVG